MPNGLVGRARQGAELSKDTTRDRIVGLLARHLRDVPDDVDWDTVVLTDLGLDSMSAIEVVLELEEELGVQFPEELLVRETFATLRSLETAVARMTGQSTTTVATFEEFVAPLVAAPDLARVESIPLSQLPVGDFAVLAWLDGVEEHYPAPVAADLVARWDRLSLRDVYALLVPAGSAS